MIHAIIAACNELSPGHSMYQAYGDTGVMHNGNMVAGPGCKRECLDSLNAHRYKLIAAKDKADARREHAQAREARS